jgi:hypothetical protein
MSNETALATPDQAAMIERVIVQGDLSRLSSVQKTEYYNKVCQSLGLNPFTSPFGYLKLQGREVLYAKKDATDQLRKIRGVSVEIVSKEYLDDLYIVTARATDKSGRQDEDTGAVAIKNLNGDAKANAIMKAITKAKRRVTLSICGLGWLDETEVETIPNAHASQVEATVLDQIRDHLRKLGAKNLGEAKTMIARFLGLSEAKAVEELSIEEADTLLNRLIDELSK